MKKSITSMDDDGMLLFNTLNTVRVHLNHSEHLWYQQIINKESIVFSKEQIAFQEQLSELGMVVDFVKAVIAPTTNCNLSCPYCFENGTHQSNMSLQTCDAISKEMRKKCNNGRQKVSLWLGMEESRY